MPTFSVGARPNTANADEGPGAFRPVPARSRAIRTIWHLIEPVGDEFDLTTCQEMQVDHAIRCHGA